MAEPRVGRAGAQAQHFVTLWCRAGDARQAGASLELRGELPHWQRGVALTAAGGGWFEASLRLTPGAYEYKLVAPGGTWLLDAANGRTRGVAGRRNNLLVVGGADEPLLHVPAPPFVERAPGGGVVVRAGLRRGATASGLLGLRGDEGAGLRAAAMQVVGREDEHDLFEVELPGAGHSVEYAFVLGDGRVVGTGSAAFRVALRELPPSLPAWWQDAVVYSIFLDRFRRGGSGGQWAEPGRWARDFHAGGDLAGVREALPWLVDLGVTVLHLTPIGQAPSPHRYDAVDPFVVDPALGGEAALAELLAAAERAGVRVLLDVPVTHLHRDAAPFRDVRAAGPASPYWSWFRAQRFPFSEGPDPGYQHYQKGQWQEPLLDTEDAGVEAHLVALFEHWTRRGAAGFRVDAAADLPTGLCARLGRAVRAIRPDAVLLGEVVPASLERWTSTGALDAATDFAAQARLADFLGGQCDAAASAAAEAVLRFRRGHDGARRVVFSACHDQPRLRSRLGSAGLARLGHLAVLLGAGVPLLYYGDEVGLAADAAGRDFEDSWPDRQCMPWPDGDAAAPHDQVTLELVRAATRLRAQREVLRRGDQVSQAATRVDAGGAAGPSPDTLVLRRRLGRARCDIVLHRGAAPITVALPEAGPEADAAILLALGEVSVDVAAGVLRLGPHAGVVLERSPQRGAEEHALASANAVLAARAFSDGLTESPAYPRRLYVTVTEACNLRCAHCITDAPRLTREGRDRTLTPAVLDALDDAFTHADYLAFTHGGESLTAPILFDVLARFQRARARRPGRADVHLASNGMLLDGARVARLLDGGLSSLMVSIDGASAAVNDAMRVGGSLARVLDNVRGVLALRAQRGADLRVGLSAVIGRGNLHEVEALAELALRLGVDWLKLEETYPATPVARLDLVPPSHPGLRAAAARAAERLAQAGLVLVDHLAPPSGCACSGDPAAVAFRAADDFANRAELAPCRAPWEQAAVDPDGTLRAVDHAQPGLGRLGEADFLALWNAAPAQRLRGQALADGSAERRLRCVQAVARGPSTMSRWPSSGASSAGWLRKPT